MVAQLSLFTLLFERPLKFLRIVDSIYNMIWLSRLNYTVKMVFRM